MKTSLNRTVQLNEKGWTEILTSTTEVEIRKISTLSTAGACVEQNKLYPGMAKAGRLQCELCETPWSEMAPDTRNYIAFTNRGTRTICHGCVDKFSPDLL